MAEQYIKQPVKTKSKRLNIILIFTGLVGLAILFIGIIFVIQKQKQTPKQSFAPNAPESKPKASELNEDQICNTKITVAEDEVPATPTDTPTHTPTNMPTNTPTPVISACPLTANKNKGEFIIYFKDKLYNEYQENGVKHPAQCSLSGSQAVDQTLTKIKQIPAGSYQVNLVAFDNHSQQPSSVVSRQKHEQYKLIFENPHVASTSATDDIPDNKNYVTTLVANTETPILLEQKATLDQVVTLHAFCKVGENPYPNEGANSVSPVCALFTPLNNDTPTPRPPTNTPTATPTPNPECNQTCENDAYCQVSGNQDLICYQVAEGDKRCRLKQNPNDAKCAYPTPTPTATPRPTNTPVPVPTNTPVPVTPGQPTNTPVPVPTNTPVPLPTTSPVPTATPAPGCNDLCETNADCSTVNPNYICYQIDDGTRRCRLDSYPASTNCTAPTPTAIVAQPTLPPELPNTGATDWINWIKVGLATFGVGAALLLLL